MIYIYSTLNEAKVHCMDCVTHLVHNRVAYILMYVVEYSPSSTLDSIIMRMYVLYMYMCV